MKEENQNVKEREMAEDQIDFRALLFKYITHWPWFVGAVLHLFQLFQQAYSLQDNIVQVL